MMADEVAKARLQLTTLRRFSVITLLPTPSRVQTQLTLAKFDEPLILSLHLSLLGSHLKKLWLQSTQFTSWRVTHTKVTQKQLEYSYTRCWNSGRRKRKASHCQEKRLPETWCSLEAHMNEWLKHTVESLCWDGVKNKTEEKAQAHSFNLLGTPTHGFLK